MISSFENFKNVTPSALGKTRTCNHTFPGSLFSRPERKKRDPGDEIGTGDPQVFS